MNFVFQMTEIVLPGLVERQRGLIVNISSASVFLPMATIYGATKSFVHYFSEALSFDYENHGILIQVSSVRFDVQRR